MDECDFYFTDIIRGVEFCVGEKWFIFEIPEIANVDCARRGEIIEHYWNRGREEPSPRCILYPCRSCRALNHEKRSPWRFTSVAHLSKRPYKYPFGL